MYYLPFGETSGGVGEASEAGSDAGSQAGDTQSINSSVTSASVSVQSRPTTMSGTVGRTRAGTGLSSQATNTEESPRIRSASVLQGGPVSRARSSTMGSSTGRSTGSGGAQQLGRVAEASTPDSKRHVSKSAAYAKLLFSSTCAHASRVVVASASVGYGPGVDVAGDLVKVKQSSNRKRSVSIKSASECYFPSYPPCTLDLFQH